MRVCLRHSAAPVHACVYIRASPTNLFFGHTFNFAISRCLFSAMCMMYAYDSEYVYFLIHRSTYSVTAYFDASMHPKYGGMLRFQIRKKVCKQHEELHIFRLANSIITWESLDSISTTTKIHKALITAYLETGERTYHDGVI